MIKTSKKNGRNLLVVFEIGGQRLVAPVAMKFVVAADGVEFVEAAGFLEDSYSVH